MFTDGRVATSKRHVTSFNNPAEDAEVADSAAERVLTTDRPIAVRIGRTVYYYADDLEAYLQEERSKAYADKKARTPVALPVLHRRARIRRFDRTTWPPKKTVKPLSATREPNGSLPRGAAELKPQKTSRPLLGSSSAGAKTWSTGKRRTRRRGSG